MTRGSSSEMVPSATLHTEGALVAGAETSQPDAKPASCDRAATTRRLLLDAALDLFSTLGFSQTSVQQIVDQAGVTKGAFYHHFESKQQVLLLLHDQFLDDELARCQAIVEQRLSSEESLRRIIVELVLSVEEHQPAVSVWIREWRFLDPDHLAVVRPKRDALERILIDVITDGIASAEFKDVREARMIAFGIVGMCSWVHEWYQPQGRVSGSAIGEIYADLVLAGLRRED